MRPVLLGLAGAGASLATPKSRLDNDFRTLRQTTLGEPTSGRFAWRARVRPADK
jgi:hypothetical protein